MWHISAEFDLELEAGLRATKLRARADESAKNSRSFSFDIIERHLGNSQVWIFSNLHIVTLEGMYRHKNLIKCIGIIVDCTQCTRQVFNSNNIIERQEDS